MVRASVIVAVFTAVAIQAALANKQDAPIPLPCNKIVVELEAKTYFHNTSDPNCRFYSTLILNGIPGATIVNGLSGPVSIIINGPMTFKGGIVSAFHVKLSGPSSGLNITFVDVRFKAQAEIFLANTSAYFQGSAVEFGDFHSFQTEGSHVSFVRSNLSAYGQGYTHFVSSNVYFDLSSFKDIRNTTFEDSTVLFEGPGAGVHDGGFGHSPDLNVNLLNSTVMFSHGEDAITDSRSCYDERCVTVLAKDNSRLTFRNCTSLARAVHANGSSGFQVGNVTTDSSSHVSCIHDSLGQFFV